MRSLNRQAAHARRAAGAAAGALALWSSGALAQDIQIETLGPVDPFSIGLLTPSEGALPSSLWRGSTPALAAEAMAQAPRDSESPAVNRLLSRTLLSGGEPPAEADSDSNGAALAARRLRVLIEAGFAADAARLAARTPDVQSHADLAESQATGQLLAADLDGACRTAELLREGRDGQFWLHLRAVCLAAAGDARADLTAQLAREEGRSEQFERAWSLILAGDAPDERVQTADPLVYAAAVRAGAIIAPAAGAPRAMRLAPLPGAAPETLAFDAGRAARIGLAAPAAAAAAYEAVLAPESDSPIDRLDLALDAEPGLREALLYQIAVDRTETGALRAQAIAASLETAEGVSGRLLAARLLTPALRTLPAEDGRDDALLFAMAAAIAGEASLARRWRDLAVQRPPAPSPAASADAGAPVPLGLAVAPWSPPSAEELAEIDALIALFAESPSAAASRLQDEGDERVRFIDAVVLDALGKSGEPDLRLRFLRGEGVSGARADVNILMAMESAAHAAAMAETALLAAAAMGPGPGELAAADLARIVRALNQAGLVEAAQEAGLEAMLAVRR